MATVTLPLLASQLGFERQAKAESNYSEQADVGPTTVSLFVQTQNESLPTERLIAALAAHLREIGVHLAVADMTSSEDNSAPPPNTPVPTATAAQGASGLAGPIALIWIREEEGQLRLQFYEPSGGRLRARSLPLASTDAASIEEVSLIVRSYVDALLDAPDAPLDAPPKDPPSQPRSGSSIVTPPLHEKQEESNSSPSVRLELGYAPSAIEVSGQWQQGAALGVVVRHVAPVSFGASYAFLTHLVVNEDVSFTLERHPISLFAGVPIVFTNRFTLEPRLALEADVTLRRSTSTSEAQALPNESRIIWSTSAQLQTGFSFSSHFGAFGTGGVSMVINRFDYVLETSEGQQVLLSTDRVRPVFILGLWGQWP